MDQETNLQTTNPKPQTEGPLAPSPLKQIRTFQGDVASALSGQKESLFSIHQKERAGIRGMSVAEPEKPSELKHSLLLFLGGLVLLALAGAGGWWSYNEFMRKTAPPVISAPESRFLSTESSLTLNIAPLTRETLLSAISSETARAGEVRHIILKDGEGEFATSSSPATFMTKLGSRAPGSLVRAFEPVFMLGLLGESRFIIFRLSSFENAFAGMLSWEATLREDLSGLFLKQAGESFAIPTFQDVIYRNKDVRALVDGNGAFLLYSFFDNQTLIITDDLETLEQLSVRLTREKLTR